MPIMILKFKDAVLGEYPLESGKSLTLGRRESNDVVIDNLAVSGNHAKIDSLEDGYLLTDLQSKNGTFVNEKLVTSHWLQKGDVIMIGKHCLEFTLTAGEEPPPDHAPMEQTMIMDTEQYREMLQQSSPDAASPQAEQKEKTAAVSFLKGGKGDVDLIKKLTKIGKDPANDIIISGFMVGRTSATISKRPKGFYLNYVEGFSKPKVNGQTVRDSVQLKEFDTIEIGSAKMEFIMKE